MLVFLAFASTGTTPVTALYFFFSEISESECMESIPMV